MNNISWAKAEGGRLITCEPENGKVIVSGNTRKIRIGIRL